MKTQTAARDLNPRRPQQTQRTMDAIASRKLHNPATRGDWTCAACGAWNRGSSFCTECDANR